MHPVRHSGNIFSLLQQREYGKNHDLNHDFIKSNIFNKNCLANSFNHANVSHFDIQLKKTGQIYDLVVTVAAAQGTISLWDETGRCHWTHRISFPIQRVEQPPGVPLPGIVKFTGKTILHSHTRCAGRIISIEGGKRINHLLAPLSRTTNVVVVSGRIFGSISYGTIREWDMYGKCIRDIDTFRLSGDPDISWKLINSDHYLIHFNSHEAVIQQPKKQFHNNYKNRNS